MTSLTISPIAPRFQLPKRSSLICKIAAALLLLGTSACDRGPSDLERMKNSGSASANAAINSQIPEPKDKTVQVKFETNQGDFTLELNEEKAPKTVANFVQYVNDGHYDGLIFHRIIDNFMIQGGGYDSNYQQRATRASIENEADNGLKNDVGTVAMARTGDPHSASSQFFINVKDNDFLNHSGKNPNGWGYAVFGKVTEGMDVLNTMKGQPTGSGGPFRTDAPRDMVIISKATVID